MRLRFVVGLTLCCAWAAFAQGNKGYYRFPTLHGESIVFTSEGDLWRVSTTGGAATRLTTHPGSEMMAAISPDGQTIAFSATYEGPQEVYTMPMAGGLPTRRTFDGGETITGTVVSAGAEVRGWTPDGKILYGTDRYSALPDDARLYTIDKENKREAIPLNQAAQGSYTDDGRTLFFTRLRKQASSTKRYEGGTAENLWRVTAGEEAVPLTANYAGTSRNAMCWKGRVYFISDRDGTMNLWSMNEAGKDLKQLTKHQGFDIQTASLSDGRIVYSMAGALRLFDTRNGNDRAVEAELPSDFDNLREHWVKNPMKYLTAAHISNDGESIVLTARGRVFVIPAKNGRMVDVKQDQPGRFRDARLMPDGKSVLVVSTETGETELWKYPANGDGHGEQLTKGATVMRWEGVPSPDGKTVAHQDRNQRLFLFDLATKTDRRIAEVDNDDVGEPSFGALQWSPDSKWLAYTRNAKNGFLQIWLYNVDSGKATELTSERYNSGSMVWSPDGKWIYFTSDRMFKSAVDSPWGSRQPDPYFDRMYKIYAVSLKKGVVSLFEPTDELHPSPKDGAAKGAAAKEAAAKDEKDKAKRKDVGVKVDIDLDGIQTRLQEVPVGSGNFTDLAVTEKRLCWVNRDSVAAEKDALQCVDIANKGDKPQTLLEGVKKFELSGDGKKMMVRKDNEFFVLDAGVSEGALKDPKTMGDAQVDLKGWTFSVIPADELKEAFYDAWRLHRDYFYDPNMHNVGWTVMRDKYKELLGHVRDRDELSDVISQMVGELSALHTFVVGGDLRRGQDNIEIGSLGARLRRDDTAGGYVVEHVYVTDPDRPDLLSPLMKEGVDVRDGDLITAINGRTLAGVVSESELLRNTAGKQVLLAYKVKGAGEVKRVVVKPISLRQEASMRYGEWEYTRRLQVEKASGGKLSYVHLRAMGANDIAQWAEQYTPIFDREGLIVDMRHNFGGNIDSWVLDRLSRKVWMYWQARRGAPAWNMQEAFRGKMVVLCDELTSSDGEAFTEGFRRLGLGKVIGTRTWGGEIWLSFDNVLADNGIASAAETGVYGPEGKWLIEGHGVEPDIVVDNLPKAAFEGKDAQLESAIAYLEKEIAAHPNEVPPHPPYPDKRRK